MVQLSANPGTVNGPRLRVPVLPPIVAPTPAPLPLDQGPSEYAAGTCPGKALCFDAAGNEIDPKSYPLGKKTWFVLVVSGLIGLSVITTLVLARR